MYIVITKNEMSEIYRTGLNFADGMKIMFEREIKGTVKSIAIGEFI